MNSCKSITVLLILFLISNASYASEGINGKKLVGFRVGTVFNSNKLDNAFGRGSELELHFVEGLGTWYGVDISLSSHNFGDSKMPDKDIQYSNQGEILELQIYSLSAAIFTYYKLSDKISATAGSGVGLYAITLIRPIGIIEQRLTDYQPGVYGSLGLLYRLTQGGVFMNFEAKYHYISSGGKNNIYHPLLFYTGEEKTGFFQICAGITLFIG